MFEKYEEKLRKLSDIGRLVDCCCGHMDCRHAIMHDCLLLEDMCNYGRENFQHITLPNAKEQVAAVQRLCRIARNVINIMGDKCGLSYLDLITIDDEISEQLRILRGEK